MIRLGKWVFVRANEVVPIEEALKDQKKYLECEKELFEHQEKLLGIRQDLGRIPVCEECGEPILMMDVPLHPKNDCKFQDGVLLDFQVLSRDLNDKLAESVKKYPNLLEVLREIKKRY